MYRARLVFSAVVLAVLLIAIEAGLRVAGIDPLAGIRSPGSQLLRPSEVPDLDYELRPGARGLAWGTRVEVNAHGFRGPAAEPGSRDRWRILVLGDSIAFGNFVPPGAEIPAQLGAQLGGPDGFEVLNFAVGGYDTLQEAALLEARGMAFAPRLVVVVYCLNDIGIVSFNLDLAERLRKYESPVFRSRLVAAVAHRLDRGHEADAGQRLNQPELFRARYRGRIDAIGADESELRAWMAAVPEVWPAVWYRDDFRVGRLRHSFRRIGVLAGKGGFRVVVGLVPWLQTHNGAYPFAAVTRIVEHEARSAGLDFLDFTPVLAPFGLERMRIPDDPAVQTHPNPFANARIAESLAAYARQVRAADSSQ